MPHPEQFSVVPRLVSTQMSKSELNLIFSSHSSTVSKSHLVTSARVCSARSATSSKVVTGDGRVYNVKQFISHPSYSENNAVAYDIAVVVTATVMVFNRVTVGPACLPFHLPAENSAAIVDKKVTLQGFYAFQSEQNRIPLTVAALAKCSSTHSVRTVSHFCIESYPFNHCQVRRILIQY